jgi:ankyrin repeat protein
MLLHAMKCMSSTVDDYVYEGATPLFIAAQNGHTEIITELIKYGADVSICRDHDTSPLFMACQEGHEKIVKILIDNGADVNVGFDDLSCLCND